MMRRILCACLALAMLGAALVSCTVRQDKYADSLRIGTTALPKNLNPYSSTASSSTFFVGMFYNTILNSDSPPAGYVEGKPPLSRTEPRTLPLIRLSIPLRLRTVCSDMRERSPSRREVCTAMSTSILPRSSGRLSERENPSVLALTRTVLLSPRPRMNSWPVR